MALTSRFGQLFLKLQAKAAIDVPEILHINHDYGQLEFYEERPPVSLPALLIDFVDADYEQHQFQQSANFQLRMRLVLATYSSSSNANPTGVKEKALEFYEIEKKLCDAFRNWEADGILYNELRRTKASLEKREDNLRVRVIDWKGAFTD